MHHDSPKPQTEGYFVVVLDEAGEIMALKRTSWSTGAGGPNQRRAMPKATSKIKVQEADSDRKMSIFVLSDAYPGMEWRVGGVIVPAKKVQTVEVNVDEGLIKGKGKGEINGAASDST